MVVPIAFSAEVPIGAHRFTVPAGFTVEQVASPEAIPRPVSASFDFQGRLYVTDSSGSSKPPKEQWLDPRNRIIQLVDADGDGRYETHTVFADKIGFIQGCLWFDGSIYAAAPPSIWKFTDTNGDGVADKREEWFKQGVLTHCGNDIHGPYPGLDGRLYWTKGAFEKLALTDGQGRPILDRAAHIFRARADLTELEFVMSGGMDNPVEVDFTPTGEAIFTSTFMDFSRPGSRDGLGHASYGSVFGKINNVNDDLKRTGEIFLPMTHFGPGAPSGLCRYQSTAFGESFRDNLFATTFNLHKITRHILKPEGATFRTEDQDFMVSDSLDFHPTDVLEDADGSLLVVDTGGWYKLCCPSSQLAKEDVLGGLYRIRRSGTVPVQDVRGLKLQWNGVPASTLSKRLEDPRPVVRQRAIQTLAHLGTNAVNALDQFALRSKSAEARRDALWTLARIPGPRAREAVRQGMNDSDTSVRQTALKVISLWRDAKAMSRLLATLEKGDPALSSIAAEALGRIANQEAVPALLRAAERLPKDLVPDKTPDQVFTAASRYLEHSLTYALIGIADPVGTRRGLVSNHSVVRRIALMALDQMDSGELKPEAIAALLNSNDPILQETAATIASRHASWGGALAGQFRDQLQRTSTGEAQATLVQQLALFARDSSVQELIAAQVRDAQATDLSRQMALQAMAASGLHETPMSWRDSLIHTFQKSSPLLTEFGIRAARALPTPKGESDSWISALLAVAQNPELTEEIRLTALATLPPGSTLPATLFELTKSGLDPAKSVSIRGAAVTALHRAKLNSEQLPGIVEALRTAGPMETTRLLAVFENQSDETLGLNLVGALRDSKAASVIRPDTLRPRLAKFPESVRKAGDDLLASLDTGAEKQRAHLDNLLSQIQSGDVRRGQLIFNSSKAACASCHKIGYLGGLVGPDLTRISDVRSARDLLEALVYPSASFVRSYEPMVVATRSGEEFTGVLKKDAADEVILLTGPDAVQRIARTDIAELRPGAISIMPQGLDQQLSTQELADLIAFLRNTKWGAN